MDGWGRNTRRALTFSRCSLPSLQNAAAATPVAPLPRALLLLAAPAPRHEGCIERRRDVRAARCRSLPGHCEPANAPVLKPERRVPKWGWGEGKCSRCARVFKDFALRARYE